METIKGFSFMPEDTTGLFDSMKYVEGDILEQTWKVSRRERLKQREQKIWEEFVQEQDIVSSVCEDDPYQFIEQLPDECVKELLEVELNKLKLEVKEETQIQEIPEVKVPPANDNQCTVTFVEEPDKDNDIYYIFDDKDGDISEPEEEVLNESTGSPPCTVRERPAETSEPPELPEQPQPPRTSRPVSAERNSSKSSENGSSSIQSSIYCEKLKELRTKINEELVGIIARLDKDIIDIEPEELPKLQKHSAEFCSRFSRVQLYQVQRQVHDMKRHSAGAPVTKHTHRQAQLVRLVSLHQNLTHALQTLNKHVSAAGCWGETGALAGGLARLLREALDPGLCGEPALTFDNELEVTCHEFETTLEEHSVKMMKFLNEVNNSANSSGNLAKTNKLKNKKKLIGNWSKSSKLPDADARLSMYSLDTGRKRSWYRPPADNAAPPRVPPKPRERKNTSSDKLVVKELSSPRAPRKNTRPPRPTAQPELHTMVEAVAPFASNPASCDGSPRGTSTISVAHSPRQRRKDMTPRMLKTNENKSLNNTPRSKTSPNTKNKICNKINDTNRVSPRTPGKRNTEQVIETGGKAESPRRAKVTCEIERDLNKETPYSGRERDKVAGSSPDDVSRLLRELYASEVKSTIRNEHVSGPSNVQLLCVNSTSPPPSRPSTPQMLRLLEESIQNKSPKSIMVKSKMCMRDTEKYRMMMSLPEDVVEKLFQYRTKFVQHMLTSSLYANNSVGKPWEMIGSVSEQIINELLLNCAKEMELSKFTQDLYKSEMF